jgi:hypothetical protein
MKLLRNLPILGVLILGSGGVSCADIAAPSRGNAYEWRRIVPTGPGTADTMSFHWPRSRLPVRIWAQDTLNLVADVAEGVDRWEATFLYGEFEAELVSDSSTADVIVRVGSAVKGGFSIIRLASSLAPECEGGTDFDLPAGTNQLVMPIRVFVNPRFEPGTPGVAECMALTTAHELGHAIGIFAHSPNLDDLMYGDPVVAAPSSRDRSTAELAYHTEATLTPGPR